MLNFSSWRRPPHRALVLTPPIISIFRLLTQSPLLRCQILDPPFSLAPKISIPKDNVKKKKKKEEENGEPNKGETFPLKPDLPFDSRYQILDPPFSLAPKTSIPKDNVKKKKKKKKKDENGEPDKGETFPLKSDPPFDFRYQNLYPPFVLAPGTFPLKSDLPFDFRYSYSETNPSVQPIGFREPPRFSPFGPGRLDRKWTGTSAPAEEAVDPAVASEQRRAVLGEPLSEDEIVEIVNRYGYYHCGRQINLGNRGVTHTMLDDIHKAWKRAEAVRINCSGVPTLDMENVCFHLEDKSGGKIIYRYSTMVFLYRGRNYDPKNRPVVPRMLWKPFYPRLVKPVADGLTFEETKEMRNRGLNSPPLMQLTRNGDYVNVVEIVREAFRSEEVVRLDCTHVGTSDCKRIGVKLKDLVPCVPILIKDEQIILWKGKNLEEHVGTDRTGKMTQVLRIQ